MANLALFCSGQGSNARKIVEYFQLDDTIHPAFLVVNKANAGALAIGAEYNIPSLVIDRDLFYNQPAQMLLELKEKKIDFIILAGFLWLVPTYLVKAFDRRILNIHPAKLPKYGGKNMYGMRVHEAVKANGEKTTGLTIHLVNNEYDQGKVLFQCTCSVEPDETAEQIAAKVLRLEHRFYAPIISSYIKTNQDDLVSPTFVIST
jgi:phosphoribosylglycinamide formyltransferase-1